MRRVRLATLKSKTRWWVYCWVVIFTFVLLCGLLYFKHKTSKNVITPSPLPVAEEKLMLTFSNGVSITDSGVITNKVKTDQALVPISDRILASSPIGTRVDSQTRKFYENLVLLLSKNPFPELVAIEVKTLDEVIFEFTGGTRASFTSQNLDAQVALLQNLLQKTKFELKGKTIDVRFGKPVIK